MSMRRSIDAGHARHNRQGLVPVVQLLGAIALVIVLPSVRAPAQVADQLMTYTSAPGQGDAVVRFDRRLEQLSLTDISGEGGNLEIRTPIVVDGLGRYWVALDPLNVKKLLRMASDGTLLPAGMLGHNPVSVVASSWDTVYAPTRIPLLTPGPIYAVAGNGSVLWSSSAGPGVYSGAYPEYPATGSDGALWLGGHSTFACPTCGSKYVPVLVRLDPTDGTVLRKLVLPQTGPVDTFMLHMAAAPDGTLWTLQSGSPELGGTPLVKTDDGGVLALNPIPDGSNGTITQIRVDAAGDVWVVSAYNEQGAFGSMLRKYSGIDGTLLAELDTGDHDEGWTHHVQGFALGADGEDVFAVTLDLSLTPPYYRLVRIRIDTGRYSAITLDPLLENSIPNGDPTGFVYANVVDQQGDNDGDGASNRAETLAGSSPYDPLSRPEGPKVYIDFTASNAIILIFKDPDGLLDPAGGLDVGAISLTVGPYGEIFSFLLPFLTFIQVSPDLTEATVVFGALPLASDLKWEVEATVTDLTGAVGWDWQVTPPGEL